MLFTIFTLNDICVRVAMALEYFCVPFPSSYMEFMSLGLLNIPGFFLAVSQFYESSTDTNL